MIQDLHSRLRITFSASQSNARLPSLDMPYILFLSVITLLLPSASFRPRLTATPLPSATSSQLSTSVRDLHPMVKEHAWRTIKVGGEDIASFASLSHHRTCFYAYGGFTKLLTIIMQAEAVIPLIHKPFYIHSLIYCRGVADPPPALAT